MSACDVHVNVATANVQLNIRLQLTQNIARESASRLCIIPCSLFIA